MPKNTVLSANYRALRQKLFNFEIYYFPLPKFDFRKAKSQKRGAGHYLQHIKSRPELQISTIKTKYLAPSFLQIL